MDAVIGLRRQDMAAAEDFLDAFCPVAPDVAAQQRPAADAAQAAWASDTAADALAAARSAL